VAVIALTGWVVTYIRYSHLSTATGNFIAEIQATHDQDEANMIFTDLIQATQPALSSYQSSAATPNKPKGGTPTGKKPGAPVGNNPGQFNLFPISVR
jgi:hypothetical protein